MENYETLGVLGEGTYGVVIKAQHRSTGRIVAIKKFKQVENEEHVKKTSMREVRMLKALKHPNIIDLCEVFRREGQLYLVFEYIERTVLECLESTTRGLPPLDLKKYMYQLLRSLEFCHHNNVIHRDVKPENILISAKGALKLCDFGFARTMSSRGKYTDYVATRWYRAPELLVGDVSYGKGVDIWAVGCIFAELSDTQPLFPGSSDLDQLSLILRCCGPLPNKMVRIFESNPLYKRVSFPRTSIRRTIYDRYANRPQEWLEFLAACLAPDPDKRLSCTDLLNLDYFTKNNFREEYEKELQAMGMFAPFPPLRSSNNPTNKRSSISSVRSQRSSRKGSTTAPASGGATTTALTDEEPGTSVTRGDSSILDWPTPSTPSRGKSKSPDVDPGALGTSCVSAGDAPQTSRGNSKEVARSTSMTSLKRPSNSRRGSLMLSGSVQVHQSSHAEARPSSVPSTVARKCSGDIVGIEDVEVPIIASSSSSVRLAPSESSTSMRNANTMLPPCPSMGQGSDAVSPGANSPQTTPPLDSAPTSPGRTVRRHREHSHQRHGGVGGAGSHGELIMPTRLLREGDQTGTVSLSFPSTPMKESSFSMQGAGGNMSINNNNNVGGEALPLIYQLNADGLPVGGAQPGPQGIYTTNVPAQPGVGVDSAPTASGGVLLPAGIQHTSGQWGGSTHSNPPEMGSSGGGENHGITPQPAPTSQSSHHPGKQPGEHRSKEKQLAQLTTRLDHRRSHKATAFPQISMLWRSSPVSQGTSFPKSEGEKDGTTSSSVSVMASTGPGEVGTTKSLPPLPPPNLTVMPSSRSGGEAMGMRLAASSSTSGVAPHGVTLNPLEEIMLHHPSPSSRDMPSVTTPRGRVLNGLGVMNSTSLTSKMIALDAQPSSSTRDFPSRMMDTAEGAKATSPSYHALAAMSGSPLVGQMSTTQELLSVPINNNIPSSTSTSGKTSTLPESAMPQPTNGNAAKPSLDSSSGLSGGGASPAPGVGGAAEFKFSVRVNHTEKTEGHKKEPVLAQLRREYKTILKQGNMDGVPAPPMEMKPHNGSTSHQTLSTSHGTPSSHNNNPIKPNALEALSALRDHAHHLNDALGVRSQATGRAAWKGAGGNAGNFHMVPNSNNPSSSTSLVLGALVGGAVSPEESQLLLSGTGTLRGARGSRPAGNLNGTLDSRTNNNAGNRSRRHPQQGHNGANTAGRALPSKPSGGDAAAGTSVPASRLPVPPSPKTGYKPGADVQAQLSQRPIVSSRANPRGTELAAGNAFLDKINQMEAGSGRPRGVPGRRRSGELVGPGFTLNGPKHMATRH